MTERVFVEQDFPFDALDESTPREASDYRHLAALSPGIFLAAALESVDRSDLGGHDLVHLIQGRMRLISHLQAELYRDMTELGYCPPSGPEDPPRRMEVFDEHTAEEIRCALVWTRRAAEGTVSYAWQITEQLANVGEALSQGLIDLPRARAIVDGVGGLDREEADAVVDRILEDAPRLTTGQIRAKMRRLAADADPDAAKKRYEAGVDERRVFAQARPEGTAELIGENLPADRVAAIMARINDLARKVRPQDSSRSMDQLRTDLFLELLEGRHPEENSRREPLVDIQVRLDTLIGLNDRAAEIPGWGPVIADIARQALERQPNGQWRVTVTDPDSEAVLWDGTTRRRPTAAQRRHIEARQKECSHPRCRMPAHRCDIDHVEPHSEGGPTHTDNSEPACRHDHMLKTLGIWRVERPERGVFIWISPHGHRYRSPP